MIKCPHCQAVHVINTVFCSECGTYLLEDDDRVTDPVGVEGIGWVGDPINEANPRLSSQSSESLVVRLKIGKGPREVEVILSNKAIHIGRMDPSENIFPEIDLGDEGLKKGVSRRHARLLKQTGGVSIEDLGSVNGTFINGKRLRPYLFEVLHDGDCLQLGRLPIKISIQR